MEKIVSLCKRRGYIFQSSEIYGGINGFWDYGPLGTELKRNLREAWWQTMTREREDVLGLDASIILNPAVWVASGHVATFADMMRECTVTNKRSRADHVPPATGNAMTWQGARTPDGAWTTDRSLELLQIKGDHPDSIRKRAREYYATYQAGLVPTSLELLSETITPVTDSVDYHPESGGLLREAKPFNLMLKTYVGPTATEDNVAYLRPETAQAIFAQFTNVFNSSRIKLPFGICQIGKAFRNEVTPRNYTFRSREFEQMELEFFIKPDEAIEIISGHVQDWQEGADLTTPQPEWGFAMWHRYWVDQRTRFYASIGLGADVLDYFWQGKEDLAHYARACVDILFKFPFGTEELEGIAARGDFDLSQHQKHSGKSQEVFDDELKTAAALLTPEQKEAHIQRRLLAEQSKPKGEPMTEPQVRAWFDRLFKGSYIPHVIEPSAGLDRLALAVLSLAYSEEVKEDDKGKSETLTILRIHPRIAPIKCGVFPLLKNKPELVAKARTVYAMLKKHMNCFYDETAAIGRRYARQDEAGTPFGITIDFETLGEQGPELQDTVTVRERDSRAQHRIKISELTAWLQARI